MFTENAKLASVVTNAIKGMTKAKEQVQVACLGIGYQVMNHGNVEQLTRLVYGLSGRKYGDSEAALILSADAKQVARYMLAHLPITWDKETQRFKAKAEKARLEFDFAEAHALMTATRWDMWGKESADNAFDETKEWKKIVGAAKRIHENSPEDSDIRKKADTIIRSFGLDIAA